MFLQSDKFGGVVLNFFSHTQCQAKLLFILPVYENGINACIAYIASQPQHTSKQNFAHGFLTSIFSFSLPLQWKTTDWHGWSTSACCKAKLMKLDSIDTLGVTVPYRLYTNTHAQTHTYIAKWEQKKCKQRTRGEHKYTRNWSLLRTRYEQTTYTWVQMDIERTGIKSKRSWCSDVFFFSSLFVMVRNAFRSVCGR